MLEYKRISDLTASGTQDGTEIIEVEQAGISKKMLLSVFFTEHTEDVDASAADYTQTDISKKQIYRVTSGAGSKNFNIFPLLTIAGCRIRIIKIDAGVGVTTILPNGGETFQGATAFPLRKQWDFIEIESDGLTIQVIDSLATLDSAGLAVGAVQNLPHGCGRRLRVVNSYPICLSADDGYSADDEVNRVVDDTKDQRGWQTNNDATNINVNTETNAILIMPKAGGVSAPVTMNKWAIRNRYKI